jgi:large subunit ribosomal protein L1
VEFRVDKFGIIHCGIGKASFDDSQLRDNFAAFMDSIVRAKPTTIKGTYVKSVTLAATMGPPVHVDPSAAARLTAG